MRTAYPHSVYHTLNILIIVAQIHHTIIIAFVRWFTIDHHHPAFGQRADLQQTCVTLRAPRAQSLISALRNTIIIIIIICARSDDEG